MRLRSALLGLALLAGCAHEPTALRSPSMAINLNQLRAQLGLGGDLESVGFTEKSFDSCKPAQHLNEAKCGSRVMTVVNFRIVCRDTEETVAEVAKNFQPLRSEKIRWKLAGGSGSTQTNEKGYGQVLTVTGSSMRGQRLVLIGGKQFLGLDISEVGNIVVPIYWCQPG